MVKSELEITPTPPTPYPVGVIPSPVPTPASPIAGVIRGQCPVCLAEYEVSAEEKEFHCPVCGEVIRLEEEKAEEG